MATAGPYVGSKFLASGLLVEVGPNRVAKPATCDWLVQVANGNPEPDSIEDCYDIIPCGARVRRHPDYPDRADCFLCEAGHRRLPGEIELAIAGPAWQDEQAERLAWERGDR